MTHLSDNLDSGMPIDIIQLDYSNAFDTLDHGILVRKL